MSKMTYSEQLKHPKWQKRRLEILDRAGFSCEGCGDKDKTLHVHHKIYHKGAMAWEYEDRELVAFCESCHGEWHYLKDELAYALTDLDIDGMGRVADLAQLLADGFHVEVIMRYPQAANK
jgi:5-methylcytosine-specific restriction endonuclease McrA